MYKLTLVVEVDGATSEEIARGHAAAQRVFDEGGITPLQAAQGWFDRDGWDDAGFHEPSPSDETLQRTKVWDEADTAALVARCAGWPNSPERAIALIGDE